MNDKQKFLELWEWESATTFKVLKALPEGKEDVRPDSVGRSARELGWTLACEQLVFKGFSEGKFDMSMFQHPAPPSWPEILDAFQKNHEESKQALEQMSEEDFQAPFKLPWRESTRGDAMMTFLHDMIHHRGQFSVYLRLAGGKVPAIYGPSADDQGM